ncbi:MAG: DegT/DnrJ/EryC1/StrS family aminotransferase [Firmicutes bacterium]|nr:DegT/DnrJ/EryC1/StrS family aminotransferase [Bacillota bacterium]
MRVMDRGEFWGTHAPEVDALQREWAEYIGTKHALVTNSGTAALHIAVAAAGVGPGDEVITSALTFVASAHAIMQQNAVPVFADIDPRTYNIDPAGVGARITERTRAIIPVHLHGMPADMDEINAVAAQHGLLVIEDACQAHGATYKGRKAGALGDMAAFSLNGSKNLPGGEGGLFNTTSDELKRRADLVRVLGEDIQPGVERDYNAFAIGWMYRYQEMAAAFVRTRLGTLDLENEQRCRNAEYLSKALRELPGIIPPHVPPDRTSVYHLFRIRFDPAALGLSVHPKEFRAKVQKALRAEGVQANRWQNRLVPMQAVFQKREGYGKGCPWDCPHGNTPRQAYRLEDYPETKKLVDDSIVMHSALYPPNGRDLLDRYIAAFQKLWENMDEVIRVSFEPDEIYIRD